MADGENIEVRDNPAETRYEILVDGKVGGFALYETGAGSLVFTHTEIDSSFEGKGLGGKLAAGALDAVRARGLKVVPECPFIKAYIDRHPAYADMVTTR